MKQNRFQTIQSFLIWFEKRTERKLYIKVFSDSSGEIGDADTNESLFKFSSSKELSRVLDRLVAKYRLEENHD